MDELDTTNTPFVPLPLLIDVTDLVTVDLAGCIVVVFVNMIDVDALTSCVPSISFTTNELPDVYL